MILLTAEDVREIDAYNAGLGQGTAVLMNAFGAAVARETERLIAERHGARRALVIAGTGNNGGDGVCAARTLVRHGVRTDILLPFGTKSETAAVFLGLARLDGIRVFERERDVDFDGYGVLVDALFGIGLDRPLDARTASLVERMNASNALRVSVDVPTGLDGKGRILNAAVRADVTVTACGVKTALVFGEGQNVCGKIAVDDLGCVYPRGDYPEYVREFSVPPRRRASHKGNYANVFVFAGKYVGAGKLCFEGCRAALAAGAGKAHLIVPESDRAAYLPIVKEEILHALPDTDGAIRFDPERLAALIPNGAVVAIGSGGGDNPDLPAIVAALIERDLTIVLDADALTSFRAFDAVRAARVIVTPHLKEFSRMTGTSVSEIEFDPIGRAKAFAAATGAVVLLKSNYLVATDGIRIKATAEGSPALAKGGSGDVLAGVVAALCGVCDPLDAAIGGAVLCADASMRAAKAKGEAAALPSDVISFLRPSKIS